MRMSMVATMKKRKGEPHNNACGHLGCRKAKRSEQACSDAGDAELVATNSE